MSTIRIGIAGYGNLGRGVEHAVAQNDDMDLVAVFTRRDPSSVTTVDPDVAVHPLDDIAEHADAIDVLVLCGGSKGDLPEQGPQLARAFNTVDSYDTHAEIPQYFAALDEAARAGGKVALIATGWDPGLFSLTRLLGEAVLPQGRTYTFWGRGLSQGHSAAVRQVPGVADAVQYTIPSLEALERARGGDRPDLPAHAAHVRECFVVLDDGADADKVRHAIVTMPHYFEPYDTRVHFITAEEMALEHQGMPHGGVVIRSAETGDGADQTLELRLALESNPGFTASVLVAHARAVHRMAAAGEVGARTIFDVPLGLLSPRSPEELRADLL